MAVRPQLTYLEGCAGVGMLGEGLRAGFRVLVDGLALVVDQSRADQLRCTGNGVVPCQAAAAFIELARRAGLLGTGEQP